MNFYSLLIVGTGGFIGSVLRFVTTKFVQGSCSSTFPWGTLAVNVIGSLVIGFLYGLTMRDDLMNRSWQFFLITGVCGGYTTFSAFAVENLAMFNQKMIGSAVLYITITVSVGLLAVFLGAIIGKSLTSQS